MRKTISLLLLGLCAHQAVAQTNNGSTMPADLQQKIQYVIVLYPENRSFDSVYGLFPGANGLANAAPAQITQTDRTGVALPNLPQPLNGGPDNRFPPSVTVDRFGNSVASLLAPNGYLANALYDSNRFVAPEDKTGDLVHRFYTEQYQINQTKDPKNAGGAGMSKFSAWSDNPGLVMSHYDLQNYGEGQIAKEFTLCDNAFHSAFGGSFLNHIWLISARSPLWPASPSVGNSPNPASATVFDANGFPAVVKNSLSDGALTNDPTLPGFPQSNAAQTLGAGDYWAVNTVQPLNGPASAGVASRLPLQTFDTIGDRLTAAGVSWAWFSGGWNDAKAGHPDPLFQFHHQPFAFFQKYALASAPVPATSTTPAVPAVDSAGSAKYLRDEADFRAALANGGLPQVSFVKPLGRNNYHPGYTNATDGQNWIADIVNEIRHSQYWDKVAIFITPDENGGLWDHVTPPKIDAWGPGTRVPFVVVSPYAKRSYVDHTQYETVSILKFIEQRWGLSPLNTRDANANAPLNAFITTSAARFSNVSTRAQVVPNSSPVISGFVISGGTPKSVLIRAVGPGLTQFGVNGVLNAPSLSVTNNVGAVIAANTGWSTATNAADIQTVSSRVGAFPLQNGSADSAALLTLAPGAYSAQVTGIPASGAVLTEVYDADAASSASRLINLSCRAQITPDTPFIIDGVVVTGNSSKLVLARAVGPTLANWGIPGVIAAPTLKIIASDGTVVGSSAGWTTQSNAADLRSAALKVGAFALNEGSTDAATLVTLAPGTYTVLVSGVSGSGGTALVELYDVP